MGKFDKFILIKVSGRQKEKIQGFAKENETSVAAVLREFIEEVRSGEYQPQARFTIYEPGTYALIKSRSKPKTKRTKPNVR